MNLRKLGTVQTAIILVATAANGAPIFFDNFDSGASALWGNERGNWIASGGVYAAQVPSNNPLTISSLPFALTDFAVEVDVNGIRDGGLYLRYDSDTDTGVLLVTGGGHTGLTGLYWHTFLNGSITGTFGIAGGLFTPGDNVQLRVEVIGDDYAAYLNGSPVPATTFTTSDFPVGQVGVYDFSTQTFDNFHIVPEPSGLALLAFGCFVAIRSRRTSVGVGS